MDEAGEYPATCANPAHEPAWEDEDDVYYACPERFIPVNVIRWHEQYQYEKEFGTWVDYNDRSSRYIDAVREYNNFVVYWRELMKPRKDK